MPERPQTISVVKEDVVKVLEEVSELIDDSLDIEESVRLSGPKLIAELVDLMRPVIRFTAAELVYSDAVGSSVNTRGFRLAHGDVVLLSDGSFVLDGASLADEVPAEPFTRRYLDLIIPRVPTFLDLVEDLIGVLEVSLKEFADQKKSITDRLNGLIDKVEDAEEPEK